MFPQAFRHAGRKKGFALDTRSHPTACWPGRKGVGLAPLNSPLGASRGGTTRRVGGRLQPLSGLIHIKGRQAGPVGIAVGKSVPGPVFAKVSNGEN